MTGRKCGPGCWGASMRRCKRGTPDRFGRESGVLLETTSLHSRALYVPKNPGADSLTAQRGSD